MKTKIILLLLLVYALAANASPEVPTTGGIALPESWYLLPENASAEKKMSHFSLLEPVPQETTQSLDLMLQTHTRAWDQLANHNRLSLLSRAGDDAMPWHLEFLALDLGVTVQGALGVMFLKGSAMMSLYWRRHAEPTPHRNVELEETSADLVLENGIDPKELQKRIEPIVKSVLATGRVHNEENFRKNLWDTAYRFNVLSQVLAENSGKEWVPARLRLDLQVEASGMVAPALSVGGGVKIRFDWFPTHRMTTQTKWVQEKRARDIAKNFEEFLKSLLKEVDGAKFNPNAAPAGMPLTTLMISLGISVSGKFGVASAGATLTGNLYLRPRKSSDPAFVLNKNIRPLQVIGGEATPEINRYVEKQGIRMTREKDGSSVYFLPDGAFQKGLDRAYEMGTYFAEHAKASEGKKFDLDSLRVQFALSVGGTAGVVTISGTGALQLVFSRI